MTRTYAPSRSKEAVGARNPIELADTLDAVGPSWIHWAVIGVGEREVEALACETALLGRVAPVRALTFSAGRTAARRALALAGCECASQPILRAPNGAPIAPRGWRVSLSHTQDVAIAAACAANAALAIGVDVERIDAVHPAWRSYIEGPHDNFPPQAGSLELAMAFSLREAIFKAVAPSRQRRLNRIDLAWTGDGFAASLNPAPGAAKLRYSVHRLGGYVVSLCLRQTT